MTPELQSARQRWLSLLGKSDPALLDAACESLGPLPVQHWLRRPETGAAMVRGRMGGSGAPFNMGEMTVTRAAVRLADGTVGMGYAAGRSQRKAEQIALIDAALQQRPERAEEVLAPIERELASRKMLEARKAAATKVDFFTLVRGDNLR